MVPLKIHTVVKKRHCYPCILRYDALGRYYCTPWLHYLSYLVQAETLMERVLQSTRWKMIEDVEAAVKYQAKRTVTVAEWVKKGNQ